MSRLGSLFPCLAPINRREHDDFLPLMNVIARHAHVVFRYLPEAHREEAIAEAVASAFESFVRLKARGKDPIRDFPSAMATFGALHVKDGRHVGSRTSSKDVLSDKAQRKHGFQVESLGVSSRRSRDELYGAGRGQRQLDEVEHALQDTRRWPVPDQAAFRIDFPAFLKSLSGRDRRLVRFLAQGNSGKQAAAKFKLSEAGVSILRHRWQREWYALHGEAIPG